MATSRLTDDEKQAICNTIDNTIKRALHNKKFPVPKKAAMEWLIDQLPKAQRKAYRLLRAEAPDLIKDQRFACDFDIHSDTHEYRIDIDAKIPRNHILVQKKDSYHADIIKWVKWERETKDAVDDASSYIDKLVWSCTSVGQLKRLLPEEIMRFIPDHLLDFSEVERRSRIPASFKPDTKRLEAMMYILTVGSISPEKYKGLHAWSEHCISIAK